jgi:hypothetical protein
MGSSLHDSAGKPDSVTKRGVLLGLVLGYRDNSPFCHAEGFR